MKHHIKCKRLTLNSFVILNNKQKSGSLNIMDSFSADSTQFLKTTTIKSVTFLFTDFYTIVFILILLIVNLRCNVHGMYRIDDGAYVST